MADLSGFYANQVPGHTTYSCIYSRVKNRHRGIAPPVAKVVLWLALHGSRSPQLFPPLASPVEPIKLGSGVLLFVLLHTPAAAMPPP